jgi:YHS domain-containing protein
MNVLSNFFGSGALVATLSMGYAVFGGAFLGAQARAEESPRPYPLKSCVVSDEKLGSMGKSYVHKHEGREVQFCCKSCLKDFNKDPKKYLKKLDDASPKTTAP